jgi:hypothetical protein
MKVTLWLSFMVNVKVSVCKMLKKMDLRIQQRSPLLAALNVDEAYITY